MEWSTLAVDDQTSSLHLKELLEGIVYTVRVMAFNDNGNGIPGEAKEIKMEEGGVLTDSELDCSSELMLYVIRVKEWISWPEHLSISDPIKGFPSIVIRNIGSQTNNAMPFALKRY